MRLTLADIIDFLQVEAGDSFDVPPDAAIETYAAKGLKPTFSYAEMLGEAHSQAFTVAKMMDVDMLGQVRTSLEAAMANGQSYKEWADELMPMLQASGWWGKQKVLDPVTGKIVDAQLGSPHRLETIFRTNMQAAYAEQQWAMIEGQKDVAPYLMYDAVDDFRTRPSHKSRDNTILPVDDPWWDKNTPPLGYACRCGIIQVSQDELEALGKLPNTKPPALGTYEWKNPRTGHTHTFPEGIDPGFDYNVGKRGLENKLERLLQEKIGTLPPDMQKAAREALAKAPLPAAQAEKVAQEAIDRIRAIVAAKADADGSVPHVWRTKREGLEIQKASHEVSAAVFRARPDLARAVQQYQRNGANRSSEINGYLRSGGSGDKKLDDAVKKLDEAVDSGAIGTPLYRGADRIGDLRLPADIDEARKLIGIEAEDKGFLSTSIFPSNFVAGDNQMLIISGAKRGALVMASRESKAVASSIGKDPLPEGAEVLLPRGTRLRITGVTREQHPNIKDKVLLVYRAEVVTAAAS